MRSLIRPATIVALMLVAMLSAVALAQTVQKQATGIVTGRVTVGDKGMANVSVQLLPQERGSDRSAVARATTDYQGNYRMTNVPAGRYTVYAVAPTMVVPSDTSYGDPGKSVTIAEGETVEKMDFALVRGGVITGRVTDADGLPVIGEYVQLSQPGRQVPFRSYSSFNPYMHQTDDRGIYRIYGIAPGTYIVSIGEAKDSGSVRFGFGGRGYYTRTFYPSVTDGSKATTVEVTEGSEASNIDITLGRKEKTYVATGRIVDENGQPAPNIRIGYGAMMPNNQMAGFGGGMPADAQGRFRLDGLLPGHYAAFVWNEENGSGGNYSDPIPFEITDSDISGLEIKLHRGASISGVVVVEGTTERAVLDKLTQFTINASPVGDRSPGSMAMFNFANTKIAPDGTFSITGLRPGKFFLNIFSYPTVPGFSLARVEHDGIAQREFEMTSGMQMTGVRLVLAYGSGSIRGLVKLDGDALPDIRRMMVGVRPTTQGVTLQIRPAQVDSRGRFLIEGLPTGEYEVILQVFPKGGGQRRPLSVKQRVSVTNGIESEVTLNLNATQPEGDNHE